MSIQFDNSFQERIVKAAMRGVVKATEEVRNVAISLILNTPKTGRVIRRHGVTHQRSAPDEAPASDTGRLVNSIHTVYDIATISGAVTTGVAYGMFLELGTRKMEPRPFLRPAMASVDIKAIIQAEIAKEMAK